MLKFGVSKNYFYNSYQLHYKFVGHKKLRKKCFKMSARSKDLICDVTCPDNNDAFKLTPRYDKNIDRRRFRQPIIFHDFYQFHIVTTSNSRRMLSYG